ncbi:Granulin, partial [Stegodyphus mimosarum]
MKLLFAAVLCVLVFSVCADDCPAGLCSSSETCCAGPMPGIFGCCPEPNAVCCSDGLHCCPANTVCNLDKGQCDNKTNNFLSLLSKKEKQRPMLKAKAADVQQADKVEIIYCPGGLYYCPDGNTCCLLPSGQYGCCPYPSAMCCSDKIHCCPYGTHCDATSQYCLSGEGRFK